MNAGLDTTLAALADPTRRAILARLAKGVCPGCERVVDLKDVKNDFCPHCGIGLHDHCGHCQARKSAFARFCHACGTATRTASAAAPNPLV